LLTSKSGRTLAIMPRSKDAPRGFVDLMLDDFAKDDLLGKFQVQFSDVTDTLMVSVGLGASAVVGFIGLHTDRAPIGNGWRVFRIV